MMDQADPLVRLQDRSGLRLGIIGGAFDPIHIAHLVIADEALSQFDLDEMVFMPAGNPPHKSRELAPAEFRHMLVSVAIASHPRFSVCRYETDRPEVAYTVDTLEHVRCHLRTDASLFLVVGADTLLDILTWKDPERVLGLCTLIAATRPGHDLSRLSAVLDRLGPGLYGTNPGSRVRMMEVPALAISSTMIRERLASGRPVRYLLPESVAEMVERSGFYSAPELLSGNPEPCHS